MGPSSPSAFAKALARLLDDTGLCSRAEWAAILRVPVASLDAWTTDRSFPHSDLLYMVVDMLECLADVPPEPLAEFRALAKRPSVEVSPFGLQMGATVEAYLAERMHEFGERIRRAGREELRRLLATGSWGGNPDGN